VGLKCGAHPHQVFATRSYTLSNAIESYHRVNSLYDGTIDCFSILAQSSVTSNETFTYKEALQQSDYHNFVKAMIHEVNNHETRDHWTVTKQCDLPPGTKTILSIWRLKQKHQRKPQQDLVDPWSSNTISNAISNVNLQTTDYIFNKD
jgi:hypothetical protein